MTRRQWLLAAGLALALVAPTRAALAQAAPKASRAAVLALLRAPDSSVDGAAWKRLGAGVDAELMRAAQDHSLMWGSRAHAYSVLGYFPTPTTRRFLEQALADKQLPAAFRAQVIRALGWGWGETQAAAVRKLVSPFRADADSRVRLAARHVIDVAGTPQARPSGPRPRPSLR